MAITNTWDVVKLEAYPEKDGLSNVVFTVHWTLKGTDGEYTGSVYGSVGVSLDVDNVYTPYNELTLTQVVGWVKDALGEEQVFEYEANVANQIENKKNPPVITPPLPWA